MQVLTTSGRPRLSKCAHGVSLQPLCNPKGPNSKARTLFFKWAGSARGSFLEGHFLPAPLQGSSATLGGHRLSKCEHGVSLQPLCSPKAPRSQAGTQFFEYVGSAGRSFLEGYFLDPPAQEIEGNNELRPLVFCSTAKTISLCLITPIDLCVTSAGSYFGAALFRVTDPVRCWDALLRLRFRILTEQSFFSAV